MKHLGDITKISGYTAPTVDCIIGGSPCQDLSIAGKRAGLDGERSGLFMEQIRIIKEMRERDVRENGRSGVDVRPRYMVWENVPGAFSSNKGEDFRIVLEETAKVADKDAVIPQPDKGKWTTSGCIVGDGWSIAWRILDAQFWGVPQRRRRIALVADFGGQSASEILFVRKSLSGDTEQSESQRKETPSDVTGGIGADDSEGISPSVAYSFDSLSSNSMKSSNPYSGCREVDVAKTLDTTDTNPSKNQGGIAVVQAVPYTLKIRSGCEGGGKGALIQTDKSATLSTLQDQTLFQPVYSIENHPADSRVNIDESGKVQTLTSRMGTGGGNVPMVLMEAFQHHGYRENDVCGTLTAGQNNSVRGDTPLVLQPYSKSKRAQSKTDNETWVESDISNTLNAFDIGDVRTTEVVVYTVDQGGGKSACNVQEGQAPTLTCTHGGEPAIAYVDTTHADDVVRLDDIVAPLQARDYKGGKLVQTHYIVRRLTPLECERLQGFPDGWTDIGEWMDSKGKVKKTSDSARYKALRNSIAIPPWKWVLKRICACYEREATMASLFDGIGGFPYIWEQINGKGSCLWASEIEEFPIAVTKRRFNNGQER